MEIEYYTVKDRLYRMALTVGAVLTGIKHEDRFRSCCHAETASFAAKNIETLNPDCRFVLVGDGESGTVAHSFLVNPEGKVVFDCMKSGVFLLDDAIYTCGSLPNRLDVVCDMRLGEFFEKYFEDEYYPFLRPAPGYDPQP
ncbi:MAG: hypothetical protein WBK77_07265 [Alphaproteobacteria bacterium]